MKRFFLYSVMSLLASALLGNGLAAATIWIEGEDANHRNVSPHNWYNSVKNESLSGNAWISHFANDKAGSVGYDLDINKAGSYTLWARINPQAAKLSYKIGSADWTAVAIQGRVRGQQNIAANNQPDLRFVGWVKVGKVELTASKQRIDFKFHSDSSHHGALDCFALSTTSWVPSGITKPGVSANSEEVLMGPDKAIWIEGEDFSSSTTTANNFYNNVKSTALSGGTWASHFSNDKGAATLRYEFEVQKDAEYAFWIRANPLRSIVKWSIDGANTQSLDWSSKRGLFNIATDNRPDMRFIAWAKAGKVKLSKGKHKLQIELTRADSGLQYHGAIDAMAFVNVPWSPAGIKKPTMINPSSIAPDSWFAINAEIDEFSNKSVIDMSAYVEAPAGKHGFLERDGEDLKFKNAKKSIKFWAINGGPNIDASNELLVTQAKWYRKHGINLIRQHTVLGATGLLNDKGEFDKSRIDRYDRWFAILKEQGIYSTWSVIYPHHGPMIKEHYGLNKARMDELKSGTKHPAEGAYISNDYINMDRELQDITLRFFVKLLEHKNPYTGLKYKDDPALAVIEFQNESNIFFHTMNPLRNGDPPVYAKMLRQLWYKWLKNRYQSKDAVAKAWGSPWDKDDKWEQGEMGLMAPYHWGDDGPKFEYSGQFKRAGDYMRFLTDLQKGYYDRRQKEIREIGFKGVTVTTAWRGMGFSSLPNLYADTAADMIDRHNYFGGGAGGHRITEGEVSNFTHLSQPGRGLLVMGLSQVKDRPFGVSEWSMLPPCAFKAEAAPLMAFYGVGLQGWDASYHFATGLIRYGDGWNGLAKYDSATPHYMGQFPALAFAIYNNHIQEGDVVANRTLSEKQIFAGRDVLKQSLGGSHDFKTVSKDAVTPPEALAIGKVLIDFDSKKEVKDDLSSHWDKSAKVINSNTKELKWNYGDKIVEVRTDKTQAILGFAGGKTIDLPGASVSVKTNFVSLIFTPLDNKALNESKNILITAMARDKQTGSVYNEDWTELKVIGTPPLLMEPVQAKISLKGAKPASVTPLDIYGVPTNKSVKLSADGSFSIDGTYQTYYYQIKR